MKTRRKLAAVLLVMLLMISMATTALADEQDDVADYVQQLLNYYIHHGEKAATDMDCLIYAISEIDHEKAQAWASIMEYWRYTNEELVIYPDILPDGLPKDDSLCIVVLGYSLKSDGSMRSELIGRLRTALASAEKYPNAYIACTGGGTAQQNKTATEADAMAQWLIEQGVSPERIIIENKSYSTVQNAQYTMDILSQDYPQITHLALVSSDYHLHRASLLFHAQANLYTYCEGDAPVYVAANAAHWTGRNKESFEVQSSDLQGLVGVSVNGMPEPKLSTLDCILVSGSAQCESGQELNLKVVAYYDTGLYRDVSKHVKYSGFDLAGVGTQTVTITYEENGVTAVTTVDLEMIPPETEPPTEPPTAPPTEPPTEAPTEVPTEPEEATPLQDLLAENWLILPIAAILLLTAAEVLIIFRIRKVKKLQQAAKAELEEEDLPADDSPLEYV